MQVPVLPPKLEHRQFLGAGGMGQVHLVYDRERGEEVALKLLTPPMNADAEEARFLFKQEYWAMASLRHPNLVAAYDYGELADGTSYLTMELVPGTDLAIDMAATEDEVRGWLPGIAAALGFLHARGYMHGDLKPENIRLREDGVPKLMDLGLLTRLGRPMEVIRGSLDYLAPECIKQGAPDGRADLYALGAVLYHVLASQPPFEEDSTIALLRAHLTARPMALPRLRPDLSPELCEAVMKLLEKAPSARFPNAAALLEALGLRGAEAGPAGLLGSPVIGREEAQDELRSLVGDDRFALRWVIGEAGSGKTRLLQEARAEAVLAGVPALAVRGLGVDAPPYQALKPMIEGLMEGAIADAEDGGELARRHAPVLMSLLPELGDRLDLAPAPPLEGVQERLRLQLAVAELALARHEQAVWLVDDADQLDPASRDMLAVIRRQSEERPWCWIQAAADAPEGDRAVVLPPLAEADGLALAQALLGQDELPAAVTDRLVALSGGQPGAIEAVLGHWLRTGALVSGPTGWTAGPAHAFDLPGGLRVALDASFEALGETARTVARTAAILGPHGDLPWLAALVAMDEAAFFAGLHELETADVLAIDHAGAGFRFIRPTQAAVLATTWGEGDRRALHGRAAAWKARRLEGAPDSPALPLAGVLEVARHALAGDQPRDGYPWALAGARRSLGLFELDPVDALTGAALAVPELSDAERLRLQIVLGNRLRMAGRLDEAIALYADQRLIDRLAAEQDPELPQERVSAAVLGYLKGKYADAKGELEQALAAAEAAGHALATARARMFLGRLNYFQGDAPTAREHLAAGLAVATSARLETNQAALMGFYGYVLASTDPTREAEGLALLNESIELALRLGAPVQANETLDLQGNVLMAASNFHDARVAFERVLDTADRLGMDLDVVTARLNLGAVMLELGELVAAEQAARKAHDGAQRQGRKFPLGYALALEGAALVLQGRPASGTERLQRGLALAREIGNRYLELNILALWAPALVELGRFEDAGDALALARQLARQTQNLELASKFDLTATMLAVVESAPDASPATRAEVTDRLQRLEQGARVAQQPVQLAHALRWQAAWRLRQGNAVEASKAAEEALGIARAQGLRGVEADTERLLALSFQPQGRLTEARAHFDVSRTLAEQLGARPLALVNEHALGVLDHDARRRRDAKRELEALNDLPMELAAAYNQHPDRAPALAVVESAGEEAVSARARDLLDWLSAIDRTEVLGDVLELAVRALVQLSEAERGFLLLFDGIEVTHQAFYGMSSADSDEYSTSLAYEVLYRGEPMIMEDVQADATLGHRASIQALSLHAVVGVPLMVDGQAIGTMLADSRRVTEDFGNGVRDLVVPLGEHVGRAIGRAREREWQRQVLSENARLFDIAISAAGKNTLEEFMAPVTAAALELTGAQQAYLLVGPQLACRAAFYTAGRALPQDAWEHSQTICQWVYDRGEPLYVADAQAAEDFQSRQSVMALGLRAVHAVPVEHEGRQLGVLYLQSRQLGLEEQSQGALRMLLRIGELIGAFLVNRGLAVPQG